jgi:hypothetical protein
LPSGKTEEGSWSFSTSNEEVIITSISFPIPLAKALAASAVHYVGPTEKPTGCAGSAKEPTAAAGTLCVYQSAALGVALNASSETATTIIFTPGASLLELLTETGKVTGASPGGAGLQFGPLEKEIHIGWGTWAVTEK